MSQSDAISNLFDALTDDLLEKIKAGEATPKELEIARQFIKDQGYQAKVSNNAAMSAIIKALPFSEDVNDIA